MMKHLTQDKITGEWIILQGEGREALVEVLRTSNQAMAQAAFDHEYDQRILIELRETGKALKSLVDQLVDNYQERKGKDPEEVPEEKEDKVKEVGVDVDLDLKSGI